MAISYKSRLWSHEDIEILLRDYYDPNITRVELSAKLKRSVKSMRWKMQDLHASKGKVVWTPEKKEILISRYCHNKNLDEKLAAELGVTYRALQKQGIYLGLSSKRELRLWTTSENNFLENNYLSMPMPLIAVKLNRSYQSVASRCKTLKMLKTIMERGDIYTVHDATYILGLSRFNLLTYARSGALKGTKGAGDIWYFKRTDLKTFCKKYTRELEGHNVNLPLLFDLMGIAPAFDWRY